MSAARRAAFGASLTGTTTTTNNNSNSTTSIPTSTVVQPDNSINSNNNNNIDKGKQKESNNNNNRNNNRNQRQPNPKVNNRAPNNPTNPQSIKVTTIAPAEEEEDDGSQCFICAEPVVYYAVGECDHRTCHTCAIRLRALYKKNACVFCKHECTRIVITASPTLPFTSFPPSATPFADTKLGISFENREQMDESLSLLRFNCPLATCNIISLGWSDLKRHAHSEHSSSLCDLCCSFKKIFSHEHTLYSGRDLVRHKNDEHMMCEFCNIGFYDADALYAHCRDRHEECFVCVKNGIRHQYHRNYDRLEAHYKSAHYLCPHPTCLEEKFVVFQSEIDLQAHAVSKHGAAAGDQRARRDARRIETNFSYESEEFTGVGNAGRGGRGGGSRGGRGGASSSASAGNGRGAGERREADGSASFVNTSDGLSRNRVIPGLGSGPRVTTAQNGNGRDMPPHTRPSTPVATPVVVESGSGDRDGTLEKHAALMERVGEVITSDSKITSFKSAVRGYKGNESSAEDLVDTLWNVFDRNIDVAAGIIRGVADLFEDQEKRSSVLSAWQDLRARQNQFPSLAPLAPALNGIPTTINTHALNNTNARSHRDPVVWARVANAAGSVAPRPSAPAKPSAPPREKFPALPMVPGMKGSSRSSGRNTPWMSATTAGFNVAGPIPSTSRSQISEADYERPPIVSTPPSSLPFARPTFITEVLPLPPTSSARQFPSLPSSSLEADRRARVRAALSKPDPSIVDREEFGTGSFWGAGGGTSGTSTRSGSPDNRSYAIGGNTGGGGGDGSGQMQKKKKKDKILLMSTGDGRGA